MSDDEVLIGQVEKFERTLVYADVAKVCAENEGDRAKFDGSDLEYCQEWLRAEPHDFLDVGDDGMGWRIEGDGEDVDVSLL